MTAQSISTSTKLSAQSKKQTRKKHNDIRLQYLENLGQCGGTFILQSVTTGLEHLQGKPVTLLGSFFVTLKQCSGKDLRPGKDHTHTYTVHSYTTNGSNHSLPTTNCKIFAWSAAVMREIKTLKCTPEFSQQIRSISLGCSVTNREPMQYRPVTFKGCSYQLFNEDRTALVPAECFAVSYCQINVYISMDIKHTVIDVLAHSRQCFGSLRAFFRSVCAAS